MPAVKVAKKSYRPRRAKKVAPGVYDGRGAYYQRSLRPRRVPAFQGTGNYGALASMAANSKGAFAPDYGKRLGSTVGEGIQSFLKVLGFGDYEVVHNSLFNGMAGGDPPSMHSMMGGGVKIRHREYIGNLITGTTGAFNLQSFPLNPGIASTFPWLSAVASCFEQYKILGMIWEFKSTSADALNSTTTSLGSVIMATEYDSSRPVFGNQQQMANHEFANSSKQSCSMMHAIECKKSLTPVSELWVRTGSVPAGDDERLYDFGLFQIATVGQQGSLINIGEIWVTYEIEFYKPQLLVGLGLGIATDHYQGIPADIAAGSDIFGVGPSGVLLPVAGSSLGSFINGANGNVLNFPPTTFQGSYYTSFMVHGGLTGAVSPIQIETLTNCSVLDLFENDAVNSVGNTGNSKDLLQNFIFKVNGQNASVTFESGGYPASITSSDLWVTQINSTITT